MIWIYLILAFSAGFVAAVYLARSEMNRLCDQLTETRNRLFDTAQKLAEAERHLHGERE